jgi:hypothetical protein
MQDALGLHVLYYLMLVDVKYRGPYIVLASVV